ncbi:MAG: hypothetical protein ACRD2I_06455 [Vicinamibacterales bacterium]
MFRGRNRPWLHLACSLLVLTPGAGLAARRQSNPATPQVDVESVGPKVGERLPAFSLHDQQGHLQSLESLLGAKGAVIVFFRSADW